MIQILLLNFVTHSLYLGLQIAPIVVANPNQQGNPLHHVDSIRIQLINLVGVVTHQGNTSYSNGLEHLSGDVVGPSISRQAKLEVGIQGVVPLVLQVVGLDLIVQTDTATFLAEIHQGSPPTFGDLPESGVELGAAITAKTAKGVACQAFRVYRVSHDKRNHLDISITSDFGPNLDLLVIEFDIYDVIR